MFLTIILTILKVLLAILVLLGIIAFIKKGDSVYRNDTRQQNPMEGKLVEFVPDENDKENADGVRGHLVMIGESNHKGGIYERYVKRILDVILSFGGLVILSPLFLFLVNAIKIDDPGPAFFTQKRVGKNKRYFLANKFLTTPRAA